MIVTAEGGERAERFGWRRSPVRMSPRPGSIITIATLSGTEAKARRYRDFEFRVPEQRGRGILVLVYCAVRLFPFGSARSPARMDVFSGHDLPIPKSRPWLPMRYP